MVVLNEENEESPKAKGKENFYEESDYIATKGDGDEVRPKEPQLGMKFKTTTDAYEFYKKFAQRNGFPVTKSSVKKNVLGEIRSYTFTCARAGKCDSSGEKPLNPQVTIKCECPARIVIRLDTLVGYVISKIELVHNHPLNPDDTRFFRCNRYISAHVRNQIDLFDRAGVRLNKVYNICTTEHGGPEKMTCTSKDCRNMVDKLRRIRLGEGDAAAILKYFAKMSAQNSGFYYKVDLDEEGHLDKVFWADGRSREAYKEFGDVISFDTTYLVNKYNMPFAPFVGVNHHGQSILLGSGLVSHENSDSFEWLFSQWLDCMSGHAPPAIITDQDLAMKKAIKIVLPNSRHRWCLWHVMKKLPEKFKSYKNYDRNIRRIRN